MFLMIFLAAAISVVDGDTVRLDGVTYRLLGFDTPETFYAQCSYERRLGSAATKRLEELIRNATRSSWRRPTAAANGCASAPVW